MAHVDPGWAEAETAISAELAEVLMLPARPSRRALAESLLDRTNDRAWELRYPPTIAVFVEMAGLIDDRLAGGRTINVGGWAADIVREVLPKSIVGLACCLEDLELGGFRVREGPLRSVLIQALEPKLERLVRNILQDIVQ